MVTLKEIAIRAGVSVPTVSQVLNGNAATARISAACAAKVEMIAAELNFHPNASARAIRLQATRQIGVLLRNAPGHRLTNAAAFEFILGINERLEETGYVLSIVRFGDISDDSRPGSRVFRERLLDGLIITDRLPPDVYAQAERHVPACVWLDTNIWRDQWCIRRDELQAGRLAAQTIVNLGYRRATYIGVAPEANIHYSHSERFTGAMEVLRAADVEVTEVCVGPHHAAKLGAMVEPHLRKDTAIIASTVPLARRVQYVSIGMRLCPGWDYGLVCCDDANQIVEQWPTLSRASFERFAIGKMAAGMMLERLSKDPDSMSGGASVLVPTRWRAGSTAWGP
ncbi:MAG TPA: LacI family DNA-binding transcriptional regulator [Tepidisphaeraceae bacterium]|jgi:LacI family transcriptional regulator|nr:LacI family DNA-binding transcriptional regulator [Tepidisphaeraceae bacterium]